MKYGLPKETEDKKGSSKRWKLWMDYEIGCLKYEISRLKEQLSDATDKIKQLTETNIKITSSISQGFEGNRNPFTQNDNVIKNIDLSSKISADVCSKNNISYNTQLSIKSDAFKQTGSNRIEARGTKKAQYRATRTTQYCPNNNASEDVMMINITAMPEYTNLSMEELRLEDYNIAKFPNLIQFFDCGLTQNWWTVTGTGKPPYKPTLNNEEFGRCSRHQCITSMIAYRSKSFEELRYEDYVLKGINATNKFTRFTRMAGRYPSFNTTKQGATSDPWFMISAASKPENIFRKSMHWDRPTFWNPWHSTNTVAQSELAAKTDEQEKLLNRILSELSVVTKNVSSLNGRLSSMDSTLVDLISRVYVMDSRLSAVDMFIMMQRVDKKWQGLEPRLASFESTKTTNFEPSSSCVSVFNSPCENKLVVDKSLLLFGSNNSALENNASRTLSNGSSLTNQTTKSNNSDIASITISNTSILTNETTIPNNSDITDLKSSSFLISNPTMISEDLKEKSNISNESLPFETNLEDGQQGNCSLSNKMDTSSIKNSPIILMNSGKISENILTLPSTETVSEFPGKMIEGESKMMRKDETTIDQAAAILKAMDQCTDEGNTSDTENEFVMIEKTDVGELLGHYLKEKGQCSTKFEVSSCKSEDFKVCNDITEYLEVNLGKRRNELYEFGFEAKPDCLQVLNNSPVVETQNNKKGNITTTPSNEPPKEDSFCTFMSNFTESHSLKDKQSSPLVVTEKNPFDNIKANQTTSSKTKGTS